MTIALAIFAVWLWVCLVEFDGSPLSSALLMPVLLPLVVLLSALRWTSEWTLDHLFDFFDWITKMEGGAA